MFISVNEWGQLGFHPILFHHVQFSADFSLSAYPYHCDSRLTVSSLANLEEAGIVVIRTLRTLQEELSRRIGGAPR